MVDRDPAAVAVPLDPEDHQRLLRLLGRLAELLGALPSDGGTRYADGADLITALLSLAERDAAVFADTAGEIRRHRLRTAARAELLSVCDALDGISKRLDPATTREQGEQLTRELREVVVAVVVHDEPVATARRLLDLAHRLARLAQEAGPWTQPLQDLAGDLNDLHDALRPSGQGQPG